MTGTTHWIAQWTKDNIIPVEINCLFGKSLLVIQEHEGRIIIIIIIYTASNYPICGNVNVTNANEAVDTRTITFYLSPPTKYFKLNPFGKHL
jgi:hypothetical protein